MSDKNYISRKQIDANRMQNIRANIDTDKHDNLIRNIKDLSGYNFTPQINEDAEL